MFKLKRRSDSERLAYLQGYEAALKLVRRCVETDSGMSLERIEQHLVVTRALIEQVRD